MFGKKKCIQTEKKTLYRVHLYIGPKDTLNFVTDVKPKLRFEEGVSVIMTSNEYWRDWNGGHYYAYETHETITYDSFDVAYYEEFEADVMIEN